jgi:2-oxoisovalerate dehydrogenase E2 component (dihydrolipoyl transacylase)
MSQYTMKVPDVGEGVVEVEIVEWLVQAGDTVSEDQHIVDVMTDKATVEITSPVNGLVVSSSGEPGDMLPVGSAMIVFESTGDVESADEPEIEVDQPDEESPAAEPVAEVTRPAAAAEKDVVIIPTPEDSPQPKATDTDSDLTVRPAQVLAAPAVRRRAREAHVDLAQVKGTGRGGRITHDDLDVHIDSGHDASVIASKAERSGTREIKVIGLRRLIAEKMALSSRSIAHFSYIEEVDVTELESLRQYMNESRNESQPKLTYMPFFMHALARLLVDFPQCNAHFDDAAGIVTQYDAVHIGVASQTANGLMVPVVKHAETMDLWDLARNANRVSEGAKNNTANKDELTGSTITITSLGALGGLASTPVINHPEVAIIGVNKTLERPVIQNGQVTSRLMMNLSSSFDHRVVDGYDAARFIQAFKGMLEHPATIFI